MSEKKKRQSKKGTRAALLKAARAELLDGNGDLEVAKVAKRAGVSDGLTYYHFGNKTGLLHAIVMDFYAKMDDQVTAILFAGDTWAEREKTRVYAMIELYYQDPIALLVTERLSTDPAFSEQETTRAKRISHLGAMNIAHAQRKGEIDSSLEPLLLVSMILAGVTAGVKAALNAEPRVPIAQAQQEIWSFVSRSAGVN